MFVLRPATCAKHSAGERKETPSKHRGITPQPAFPDMATIIAAGSRRACRHGRAIPANTRRLLSSAAAAERHQDGGQTRLDALRERLKDETDSAVKLQDFSFSGNVSYGTAVPRRTRDSTGKVGCHSDGLVQRMIRTTLWHICMMVFFQRFNFGSWVCFEQRSKRRSGVAHRV